MKFKLLQLKKVRESLIMLPKQEETHSGRRDFMRTLGIGMLSLNPVSRTFKAISNQPFDIRVNSDRFSVSRNGSVDWEISRGFFEKGFLVSLETGEQHYMLSAKGLKVNNSDLSFSLDADIHIEEGSWVMDLKIPGLGVDQRVDFLGWLDKKSTARGAAIFDRQKITLNTEDVIEWEGDCPTSLDAGWKMEIKSEEGISLNINGNEYVNKRILLEPYSGQADTFLGSVDRGSLKITAPGFEGWNEFITGLKFYDENSISVYGSKPDLHGVAALNNGGTSFKALWVNQKDGGLVYNPSAGSEEQFSFSPYLWYSEYREESSPQFYLAGKLNEDDQWVSGRLGSMKFSNNPKYPGFEAFGFQNTITRHICELLMQSFKPIVAGAVTLPFSFPEAVAVSINTSGDFSGSVKDGDENAFKVQSGNEEIRDIVQEIPRNQKPVNIQRQPAASSVSQLKINFREIKLEPRRAVRISLLRPEDLIQLDFEFHNFVFSNKGQGGFLQLSDNDQKGVMIVHFPTQHTLEEAWFETAKVPSAGKEEPIILPARQIRARKSRLVYELEAGSTGFPLMIEELLNWSRFNLRVHPRAYIKLPQLLKVKSYVPVSFSQKRVKTADRLLERKNGSLDYQLKLMQKKRVVDQDEYFLKNDNSLKLFNTNVAATVAPSFSFANISKELLKPAPVPDDCTSIEAPALMYISPNQINDFVHSRALKTIETSSVQPQEMISQLRVYDKQTSVQKGAVTELWHTVLGVRLKDGKVTTSGLQDFRTIRVLWAFEANEDYKFQAPLYKPFMTSLDASDRQILVHQTSNFSEKFTPVPVPVKSLMLTTLGAYLNWHVFFSLPPEYTNNLNIIEWQHLATLGRDHYVKVVREGYIFPFGHKAALVKITERKFHNETRAALNRQRMYVVILEKEVAYRRTDPDNAFIEFPFEKIRIVNDYTPDIDHPSGSTLATFSNKKMYIRLQGIKDNEPAENVSYNFYICVGGGKFMFDIEGIDKEGFEHKFRIPFVFVENIIGRTKENVDVIVSKYNEKADEAGTSNLNGQKVAFADCLVDGDTAFETKSVTFNGQYYPAKGVPDLKFHPKMKKASIYLRQVEELTGKRDAVQISLTEDSNAGHVFAAVTGAKVDFTGGSDKSGGFLSPNMDITALSRLQGPVGGSMANCKNLTFDAMDFFKSASLPSAKIFGCIDIFSLLNVVNLGGTLGSYTSSITSLRDEIDSIKSEILSLENEAREKASDLAGAINSAKADLKAKVAQLLTALNSNVPRIPGFKTYLTEEAFYAEYRWQPDMKKSPIEVFPEILTVKVKDPSKALQVTTLLEKPFDTARQAKMSGSAKFSDFEVVVAQMIGVGFKSLEFKTGSSQKTDVKVELVSPVPISFMGPLSFVNSLQNIIPASGFGGDGPYVDLSPTGVTAGFSISIPSIEIGVCSIANISLGASITLPFTGDPLLLAFNFCTRENPFLLTVSCFGGGGFFRLVTSLKQIESVEAAFEFGASMSLNVGVASGSVSAMGGIYFKTEHAVINGYDANIVILTSYLRLNGRLSILGLITVSLEFYLAFTANFISKNGKKVVDKLVGEATLKVKVEVLFFSKTVSVSVRREIQGADADPKFTQMILPEDWEEYCLAFAG